MNKTDRKNKTNLIVNWPTHGTTFSIKDLLALNPEFKEITLRVRVEKAIKKEGLVSIVGYKNAKKGRPTMVLSLSPVAQSVLDEAYKNGVQPPDTTPNMSKVAETPVSTSETQPTDVSVDASESSVAQSTETSISA